jgi:hypothetical protein
VPFVCSICEQESTKICAFCTKDACDNHLCERCGCCSDCCECDVPLDEATAHPHPAAAVGIEPGATAEPPSPSEPAPVPEVIADPAAQPAASDEPPPGPPTTPEA